MLFIVFTKCCNNYVRLRNTRMEMYAGRVRVACCPLVSHVEYAPRPIKVRKRWDRQTDVAYITFTARRRQRNKK